MCFVEEESVDHFLSIINGSPPYDIFLKSKAPTKVCFLAWATTKGETPMEDMLRRRNFKLPSLCSMCFVEEELVDHLLVHCRMVSNLWHLSFSLMGMVSNLWHLSFSLMGISWVQPKTTRDALVAWRRWLKKCWVFKVWELMPLAILVEYLDLIFEGKVRSIEDF